MPDEESPDSDNDQDKQARQPLGSESSDAPGEPESPESEPASAPAEEPLANSSPWRRAVTHKAFVPAIALGGLAVGAVVLLVTRSLGPTPQLMRAVAAHRPELAVGVVEKVAGVTTRNSPVGHTVHGYLRQQHYGADGSQIKLVEIAPYVRGVTG